MASRTTNSCETAASALPTRVIDVGLDADNPTLRLVVTSGQRGEYIALSHCWGAERLLTATKSSLSLHLQGMFFGELPLTFKHAVSITRGLDYKYLWINSMCIIQDDEEN